MRIGEVSRITGLPASTIRFYESNGLIASAQRRSNRYRDYPESVLGMLEIIKLMQQLGFSLDDIRSLLPPADHAKWEADVLIQSLQGKLEEIRRLQQRVAQTADQLGQVIAILQNRSENESCEERRKKLIRQLTQRTLGASSTAGDQDRVAAACSVFGVPTLLGTE